MTKSIILSELRKRPGRIETFAFKLLNSSPFMIGSGGSVSTNQVSISGSIIKVDSDNQMKIVINLLENTTTKNVILIPLDGSPGLPLSKISKTTEFGGLLGSAGGAGATGNLGDLSEAVFSAALTAKFISKNSKVQSKDVHDILDSLNDTKQRQIVEYDSPNRNTQVTDRVILRVGLSIANLQAIQNKAVRASLSGSVIASLKFTNSKIVEDWSSLLYENDQKNLIEIISDGIGDQTGTTVDVRLKVDGELTDINVSLKAGAVKQFGQVSGAGFDKQKHLWNKLLGVDIRSIEGRFVELQANKQVAESIILSYTHAASLFNNMNQKLAISNLAKGLKEFSTRGEENVIMVSLNNKEANIYKFGNLYAALHDTGSTIKAVNISSRVSGHPEVHFSDNRGAVLFVVRSKFENRPDGTNYIRNYVEKGPLLSTLISYYA